MRSFTLISVILLFSATATAEQVSSPLDGKSAAGQVADTSQFAVLDARLEDYLEAIKAEPTDIQKQEADFLIEVCSDSLVRQRTALKIYGHFISSPVMGTEAVAIHVYDKWFATGKVRMQSDSDLFAARLFAETNRRSLIGCPAPQMTLYDTDGKQVSIMAPEDKGWRIIFFYDTDCAKCRLESIMLRSVLENNDYPVTFYAVYIGTDKEAWTRYISERLDFNAKSVRTVHLWDPELTADIGYNYGVFQTPKIFLVNPQGMIIGRGLDSAALEQLMKTYLARQEYGSEASAELYDKVFAPLRDSMTCSTVSDIADYIEKSTLQQGDTLLCKQMTGDLLYYITNQRSEAFKCGTEQFADKYILSRPDIWNTPDDSLQVIGLASMLKGLASLAPVGSTLPEIKIHGTLKTSLAKAKTANPVACKSKPGIFDLSALRGKGRTIIIFHTEGCGICEHELAAADTLLTKEKGLKVLEINMDELFSSYPSEADALMRTFDLSSLPFILETDTRGRIARKYISLF